MEPKAHRKFVGLPLSVSSPAEVNRLIREVNVIDDKLLELKDHKAGESVKMPKTSKLMDELVELNKVNLLDAKDRADLKQFLAAVKKKAPVVNISFAADPSAKFIGKIMEYLRSEIHPLLLLAVGLEPAIGAGCILRTTNKQFDFSLGKKFKQNENLLLEKIKGAD